MTGQSVRAGELRPPPLAARALNKLAAGDYPDCEEADALHEWHRATGRDEGCFGCKVNSIQWSPSATPNHYNSNPPPTPAPVWEKGELRDRRGMPLLAPGELRPLGVKELAANRSKITGQLKRQHQIVQENTAI